MRLLLCLSLLLVPALPARGADDVLQLRSGRLVVGTITATDADGVTVRTEAGEARFDWSALTPLTEYEVRSDRLKPDDAAGRVELAELCIRHALYPYARKEIATARGLGYEPANRLDEIEEAANDAEAEEAFARVEQLVAEEDYDAALDVVRRFLIQAPKSERTEKARGLANDLLRRRENQRLAEKEAAEAAEKAEMNEALAKKIESLVTKSEEYLKAATGSYAEALKYHEIGNVTRARKGYQGAESGYLAAFRTLRTVQRTVRRGVAYDKAEDQKAAIRAKLVQVYLGLAKLYVDDRNYRSGTTYVNKALYLDPVNKQAMAMRREIDENRLHRSARRITNTPGVRTTSGN